MALLAGDTPQSLTEFAAADIVAARYLPRVLGQPFSTDLLDSPQAIQLSDQVIAALSQGLDDAAPQWMPTHAFSLDGYLQFQVRQDGGNAWVSPGAVLGHCAYYSVLREDTTLTYVLRDDISDALQTVHDQAVGGATTA